MTDLELTMQAFIFFQQFKTRIELLNRHMRHIDVFQQVHDEMYRTDTQLRILLEKITAPREP